MNDEELEILKRVMRPHNHSFDWSMSGLNGLTTLQTIDDYFRALVAAAEIIYTYDQGEEWALLRKTIAGKYAKWFADYEHKIELNPKPMFVPYLKGQTLRDVQMRREERVKQ
jgi:hypothetical protein